MSASGEDTAADPGVRVGLAPGTRYKCEGCGNLTRFDVSVRETSVRFWHVELSGEGRVESEEADREVQQVACRWCGSSSQITVVPTPLAEAAAAGKPSDAGPEG